MYFQQMLNKFNEFLLSDMMWYLVDEEQTFFRARVV